MAPRWGTLLPYRAGGAGGLLPAGGLAGYTFALLGRRGLEPTADGLACWCVVGGRWVRGDCCFSLFEREVLV